MFQYLWNHTFIWKNDFVLVKTRFWYKKTIIGRNLAFLDGMYVPMNIYFFQMTWGVHYGILTWVYTIAHTHTLFVNLWWICASAYSSVCSHKSVWMGMNDHSSIIYVPMYSFKFKLWKSVTVMCYPLRKGLIQNNMKKISVSVCLYSDF